MTWLRAWFGLSGALIALGFTWAYVPILIPIVVLAALLGGVSMLMVKAARWLERWRDRAACDR